MSLPFSSKNIFSDRLFSIFFFTSKFFNILLWALILYKVRPQEEPLFLHYNIYFGIDMLGTWKQIYLMPISGSMIIVLNDIIALFAYKKEKIVCYLLGAVNIIAQLVLMVASVLIILMNF